MKLEDLKNILELIRFELCVSKNLNTLQAPSKIREAKVEYEIKKNREIQYLAKRYPFSLRAQSSYRSSFNNCVIDLKNIPSCRKFNSVQGTVTGFSATDL